VSFRVVEERTRLELSRGVRVVEATCEAEDGRRFDRDVIRHPGAVAVVPMLDESTAVLVRQFRVTVGAPVLEIPAGIRDVDGEDTATTAGRELAEEVGFAAGSLVLLGELRAAVGLLDERCWIYLATDLRPVVASPQGHEEEAMTVEHVRLDRVPAMAAAGELVDMKTVVGLLLARDHLGSQ
jgi:8-oxo-dGTP pyrophosphatase MutT (NUDIX family)